MHATHLVMYLLILVTFASCSGDSDTKSLPSPQPSPLPIASASPTQIPSPLPQVKYDALFPETKHWGEHVQYQTIGDSYRNDIRSASTNAAGDLCYIQLQKDNAVPLAIMQNSIECFNNDGTNRFSIPADDNRIFKDLLLQDNGQLVVAELALSQVKLTNNPTKFYYLQLSRYASSGQLLQQKILIDKPEPEELLFYSEEDDKIHFKVEPMLADGNKPILTNHSIVELKEKNNSLFLLAYTYGVKIYQLNDALSNEFDIQVMPAHTYLWTNALQNKARFDISENGSISVAFELYGLEANMYNHHFNRNIDQKSNRKGVAVDTFDSNGVFLVNSFINNPTFVQIIANLVVDNNSAWLGSIVRHKKENASGGSTEWDLLFHKIDRSSGQVDIEKLINLDKEDTAYDFAKLPNGNFVFAGATGYKQADTNSQISFGDGFILEVNPIGKKLRLKRLNKPRNVGLDSIQVVDSNRILFSGFYDGPITHTCDKEENKEQCYNKAVLGLIHLANPE